MPAYSTGACIDHSGPEGFCGPDLMGTTCKHCTSLFHEYALIARLYMLLMASMGHTANWYAAHASLSAQLLRTCLYGGPHNLQQHNSDIHTIEWQQTSQDFPAFTCLHPTA